MNFTLLTTFCRSVAIKIIQACHPIAVRQYFLVAPFSAVLSNDKKERQFRRLYIYCEYIFIKIRRWAVLWCIFLSMVENVVEYKILLKSKLKLCGQ